MITMNDYMSFVKELQYKFGTDAEKYCKRYFELKYGSPLEHTKLTAEDWTISKFKKEDLDSQGIILGDNGNLIKVLEKLETECNSNPNTTIPRLQYEPKLHNILLLAGLTLSAQRDTAESSTSVTHIGVGTDSTAEAESQTGLITASGARKSFTSSGQRKVVNQTAKFNMVFSDSDLSVPLSITEGATFTAVTSGTCHCRLNFPSFSLTTGEVITFQINETHQNG